MSIFAKAPGQGRVTVQFTGFINQAIDIDVKPVQGGWEFSASNGYQAVHNSLSLEYAWLEALDRILKYTAGIQTI